MMIPLGKHESRAGRPENARTSERSEARLPPFIGVASSLDNYRLISFPFFFLWLICFRFYVYHFFFFTLNRNNFEGKKNTKGDINRVEWKLRHD